MFYVFDVFFLTFNPNIFCMFLGWLWMLWPHHCCCSWWWWWWLIGHVVPWSTNDIRQKRKNTLLSACSRLSVCLPGETDTDQSIIGVHYDAEFPKNSESIKHQRKLPQDFAVFCSILLPYVSSIDIVMLDVLQNTYSVRQKQYPLKFFAIFLATAQNFYMKFHTFITHS